MALVPDTFLHRFTSVRSVVARVNREIKRNPPCHVTREMANTCGAGWHQEDHPLLPATVEIVQARDDCLCLDARALRRVLLLFYALRCYFSARGWSSACPDSNTNNL